MSSYVQYRSTSRTHQPSTRPVDSPCWMQVVKTSSPDDVWNLQVLCTASPHVLPVSTFFVVNSPVVVGGIVVVVVVVVQVMVPVVAAAVVKVVAVVLSELVVIVFVVILVVVVIVLGEVMNFATAAVVVVVVVVRGSLGAIFDYLAKPPFLYTFEDLIP